MEEGVHKNELPRDCEIHSVALGGGTVGPHFPISLKPLSLDVPLVSLPRL